MPAMFCPRCDRVFTNRNDKTLLERVKEHVELAHPDHDPDWWREY